MGVGGVFPGCPQTPHSMPFHQGAASCPSKPSLLTKLLPANYFLAFLFWVQISQTSLSMSQPTIKIIQTYRISVPMLPYKWED